MSREEKEFKRRLKKMQKHVEALREISDGMEEDRSLDTIQGKLNELEGGREKMAQAGLTG